MNIQDSANRPTASWQVRSTTKTMSSTAKFLLSRFHFCLSCREVRYSFLELAPLDTCSRVGSTGHLLSSWLHWTLALELAPLDTCSRVGSTGHLLSSWLHWTLALELAPLDTCSRVGSTGHLLSSWLHWTLALELAPLDTCSRVGSTGHLLSSWLHWTLALELAPLDTCSRVGSTGHLPCCKLTFSMEVDATYERLHYKKEDVCLGDTSEIIVTWTSTFCHSGLGQVLFVPF